MAIFTPPINTSIFASKEDITAWIYQVWTYLQANPILNETTINEFTQKYLNDNLPRQVVTSVNKKKGEVTLNATDVDAVSSVNGKTGAVTLNAVDVGAYSPSNPPNFVDVNNANEEKYFTFVTYNINRGQFVTCKAYAISFPSYFDHNLFSGSLAPGKSVNVPFITVTSDERFYVSPLRGVFVNAPNNKSLQITATFNPEDNTKAGLLITNVGEADVIGNMSLQVVVFLSQKNCNINVDTLS